MRSSPGFSLPHLRSDQNKSILHCTWPERPHSTPTTEVFNYSSINEHIAITPFCQAWGFFYHPPNFIIIFLCKQFIYHSHLLYVICFGSCFSKPFIWVNVLINTLVRSAPDLAKRSCCQAFLLKPLSSSWSAKYQLDEKGWESKYTCHTVQGSGHSPILKT